MIALINMEHIWASLHFSCLDRLLFSPTTIMDVPACVAWLWLVTGFHPWSFMPSCMPQHFSSRPSGCSQPGK